MERITKFENGCYHYPICFSGEGGLCPNGEDCDGCDFSYKKCERIGKYEDTGLTPEEVEHLKIENAALKARLDKAVDIEQKEEIEWDKIESKVMKLGSKPMHYVYTHKITGEKYRLGDLQNKYGLGFADSELWKIIERDYEGEIRPQKEWTRL